MSERTDAEKFANRLLAEPYADPDDDLQVLSRQFLRRGEVIERLQKTLIEQQDGTREANRDSILKKHEEAIRLIQDTVNQNRTGYDRIEEIIKALNLFHPMHGESWCGWPGTAPQPYPPADQNQVVPS